MLNFLEKVENFKQEEQIVGVIKGFRIDEVVDPNAKMAVLIAKTNYQKVAQKKANQKANKKNKLKMEELKVNNPEEYEKVQEKLKEKQKKANQKANEKIKLKNKDTKYREYKTAIKDLRNINCRIIEIERKNETVGEDLLLRKKFYENIIKEYQNEVFNKNANVNLFLKTNVQSFFNKSNTNLSITAS